MGSWLGGLGVAGGGGREGGGGGHGELREWVMWLKKMKLGFWICVENEE